MNRFLRHFLLVATLASGVACNEPANLTTEPDVPVQVGRDNSPVQTELLDYQLVREPGAYRARVVARYVNKTGTPVFYQRCNHNATSPMFGFGRTGADSLARFFSDVGWACVGGIPTGTIAPGDSTTVSVLVGSGDQPMMTPALQREWIVGTFRIALNLCTSYSADSDNCVLLPAAKRQSNAFVVHY